MSSPIVQRGDPPSTYCALAFIEGQPGSGWRFAGATAVRSLFILPGLAFAGARGWGLVKSSLFASMSISTVLLLYYGYKRADSLQKGVAPPWENGWGIAQMAQAANVPSASTAGLRGVGLRGGFPTR
jgi:hypothetical protein